MALQEVQVAVIALSLFRAEQASFSLCGLSTLVALCPLIGEAQAEQCCRSSLIGREQQPMGW